MKQKRLKNSGVAIYQGNVACAEGALAAGCRYFAGYPITPASEIPEYLSSRLPEEGGSCLQMEDELASVCSAIGASWGGVRSMTATSGPGFSLMQEAIGYAVVSETPIVIVDVMRGGPSTGQPTSSAQQDMYQSRYGSHGDYEIIALCPSSVQEMFDFTVRAFNLAEEYRTPVILLADEVVGHMREKITIPDEVSLFDESFEGICEACFRPDERLIPPRVRFFEGHNVLIDGQLHDERGIRAGHLPDVSAAAVTRYCKKITDNIDAITICESFMQEDMDIAFVAYGSVSRSALAAARQLRAKGIKAGLLKLNTIWPFPDKKVLEFCRGAKLVIVPEMNIGQIVREVARVAGNEKTRGLPLLGGTLHSPAMIMRFVEEVCK